MNVATLLVGEASGRRAEFATRVALGAGRARVARQEMLVESLAIAAGGVGAGAIVATAATRLLVALAPANVPRLSHVGIDGRVFLMACLAGVATALMVALLPAATVMTGSPASLLGSGAGRATARHEQRTLRTLVAGQVALSCLLLVTAALLRRSVARLSAQDAGFPSDRLALVALGTTNRPTTTNDALASFYAAAAGRVKADPGVERAAVGSAVPFSGGGSSSSFVVEGATGSPTDVSVDARRSHVLPGFLKTLGVRLVAGRLLDERDRAARHSSRSSTRPWHADSDHSAGNGRA